MKHLSKKIAALLLTIIVCVGLTVVLSSYTNSKKDSQETIAVVDGLLGAEKVIGECGKYESKDGLTASLSDSEISTQIDDYNQQVDRYYTKENPCREIYKNIHREHLEKTVKQKWIKPYRTLPHSTS